MMFTTLMLWFSCFLFPLRARVFRYLVRYGPGPVVLLFLQSFALDLVYALSVRLSCFFFIISPFTAYVAWEFCLGR